MRKSFFFGLVLALLLTLALTGAVLAQDEDPSPDETTTTTVEGTIVAVDLEAGTITLDDGTVIYLGDSYDHPIVDLLNTYFSGASAANLSVWADALDALQLGGDTVVSILSCDETTQTCLAEMASGATVVVTEEEAAAFQEALDALTVSLEVTDDGTMTTVDGVGDDIAAYHESGLGFGELVKLYAIVAECEENAGEDCDLTVEFLIGEYQNGMGMGELFALYGRPSLLGVGHVRQALRDQGLWSPGGGDAGGDEGDGTNGICNARAHGGNAHATGQGEITCP